MTEAGIDTVLETFVDEPTGDSGVWMGGVEGERYVGDIGNEGVHGIARRAGFIREGLLHSYLVERGKAVDAVIFSSIDPERVKR